MSDTSTFSLLWPPNCDTTLMHRVDSDVQADLNVRRLVRALAISPIYESHVQAILLTLTTDPQTIQYRQAVIDDLLRSPELVQELEMILETILTLESYLQTPQWRDNQLRQVAWRLSELERYVETVESLHQVLQAARDALHSDAMLGLLETINALVKSENFQQLHAELPTLIPQIRNVRSITIGINLDANMRPLAATILSANPEFFEGESMISRLFGFRRREATEQAGAGPLHDARKINGINDSMVELDDRNSPFMPPLFKDLSELLDATSRPIVEALRKYTQVNSQFLISLKQDIAFYLGAVRMVKRMQDADLAICQPNILPQVERQTHLNSLYNINLALQQLYSKERDPKAIIGNNVTFDDEGRIFVLTGPNQGGKTTYTQAIGLAQMLFQAGLHVPAHSAQMSVVDTIYTHFAKEERPNLEAGRLGEEAKRLNDIFQQATRYSLVLLNESLASTAAGESLFLARDVVRAFRLLGVRAVFATHLHELAASADAMNVETTGDSTIISVVSQVEIETTDNGQQVRRTYHIAPGPPMSKSYALELAARYGLSYEQITATLRRRDLL